MISDAPDRPAISHVTIACRETLVWMRAHFRDMDKVVFGFSDLIANPIEWHTDSMDGWMELVIFIIKL